MQQSEFEDAYDDDLLDYEPIKAAVLETPIGELMAKDPIVVSADANVATAVNAMNTRHTGCVLVEKEGKLVGIFTERDVLRKVIFREGNQTWKVEAVMTPNPITLPPTASVAFALNKMSVDGFRHIPIVDTQGQPIGVVSVKNIVHFVADLFQKDVINLPSDPELAIPRTADGG